MLYDQNPRPSPSAAVDPNPSPILLTAKFVDPELPNPALPDPALPYPELPPCPKPPIVRGFSYFGFSTTTETTGVGSSIGSADKLFPENCPSPTKPALIFPTRTLSFCPLAGGLL